MRSPSAHTLRCSYLFYALLLLLVVVPLLGGSDVGRIAINLSNLGILLAAVVAICHSRLSIAVGVVLALPVAALQVVGVLWTDTYYLMLSWVFGACFYCTTLSLLLRYVFLPHVMNADKLYGAAAAYLMLGVLWAYFFAIIQYFFAGAFAPASAPLNFFDLLYFSFTVLTTAGFGDIAPVHPAARSFAMFEEIVGVLYVAILIARLSGMYPTDAGRK